jgi:hypothetical protein
VIRKFLERTGMSQTPFGLIAAGDDKLLWRIEHATHGISLDKADRIMDFIERYEADMQTAMAAGVRFNVEPGQTVDA